MTNLRPNMHHPWVIGHRGACGHWPENTLPSIRGAHVLGVDWVEIDAVLTRDGVVALSHDLWLDAVTDVAARFPGRARADGRTYAADLDWAEVQTLRVGARRDEATGAPVFPSRRLEGAGETGLCRLRDAVAALRELNAADGHRACRRVGLVVEAKFPAWHAARGLDLAAAIRAELADAGDLPLVIETFDPHALRAWCQRADEWPEAGRWGWWQLLGENAWGEADCDYDELRTADGLRRIAGWADGVAINLERATPDFSAAARAAGLAVFAYTARAESADGGLPAALVGGGLDGIFADQPEIALRWRSEWANAKGLQARKM